LEVDGSPRLFLWAGLEPWSFLTQSSRQLWLQVWARAPS
jgi:hypothetical protein